MTAVASLVLAQVAVAGSVTVFGPRDEMCQTIYLVTAAVKDAASQLSDLYGPRHLSGDDVWARYRNAHW